MCCFSNNDNDNIKSNSTFKASHMVMSNFKVSRKMHFLSISWEKRTNYWLIIYVSSINSSLFLETDLKKQVSASEPPDYSFFTPLWAQRPSVLLSLYTHSHVTVGRVIEKQDLNLALVWGLSYPNCFRDGCNTKLLKVFLLKN